MKARVKATGEILDVKMVTRYSDSYEPQRFYQCIKDGVPYKEELLDFNLVENYEGGGKIFFDPIEPNYWDKLKHQYAGMAMQGILSCPEWNIVPREGVSHAQECALQAQEFAHALVEKLKESK